MNTTENRTSIARYIWRIFQYSAIPLSWGICFASVRTLSNGTEFHVQGFKMTGYVKIEYDEGSDTFTITLTPDDNLKNRITWDIQDYIRFTVTVEKQLNEKSPSVKLRFSVNT